jgi:carbon monoxide dehydrogenase subunit G
MKIEKSFSIDAPQEDVWQFVSAPEKVGKCFPGCQSVTALGDEKYKAEIKVKVGPIKTVFNVEFEETEKRPSEFAAYTSRGEEGNRASRLKAKSTLTLSPIDANRTQVDYGSESEIEGPPPDAAAVAIEKRGLSGRQKLLAAAAAVALIALLAWLLAG